MISLILNFALFLLVLFIVVPGLLIGAKLLRDYIHQHTDWRKGDAGKLAG